tara:strand:+ start:2278 stop:2703 length:426 start_codon:yes stop_codon:yes gene_type:complete
MTEEERWRDLVGGFILTFGEIELFTYHIWSEYLHGQKPPRLFASRTKALIAALQENLIDHKQTINALNDALSLAKKRNTIAHNPTMVEVFEHTQTGETLVRRAVFSRRSDEFIDDAELQELIGAAEDIVVRLYRKYEMPRR